MCLCHAVYTFDLGAYAPQNSFLKTMTEFVRVQIGYLSSWSACSTYRQKHPDHPDPLVQFREDYMKACGFTSDDESAKVTHPLFVILAKDPQPL